MNDAAYSFPSALERITAESPPQGMLTVSRTVMVLVAVMVLWSLLGRLDIVVIADGKLVPESYVKIVQPTEAGVVREILVHEGDHVQQGQVLMRMDGTLNTADTAALTQTLGLRKLELRRTAAELSGKPFTTQSNDDLALFREAKARYDANRAAWSDSAGSAEAEVQRVRSELAAARQERTRLEKVLPVYTAELAAMESLRSKGYVSELDYNAKKRDAIDTEQNLESQRARVQGLEAAEQQAIRKLSTATTGYRADLERERTTLTDEVQQLEQQVTKQAHRNESLALKAPQAGIVKDLATHTAGTVVSPGTVMLSLVPDQERLHAEVYVRNEDIGRLKPGLPVQIKVHAFRFQRYGMLDGVIEQVSPDTAGDDESQDDATREKTLPTYKAIVSLSPVGDGAIYQQSLTAGMSVSAEVDVGTRTPFEYLVDPVRGTLSEAGRE